MQRTWPGTQSASTHRLLALAVPAVSPGPLRPGGLAVPAWHSRVLDQALRSVTDRRREEAFVYDYLREPSSRENQGLESHRTEAEPGLESRCPGARRPLSWHDQAAF